MSDDDYPTEDTLRRIREWPADDPNGCLDFVADAWSPYGSASHNLTAHEGYVVSAGKNHRYLRLATGGWSGNDDIVSALRANLTIHRHCWCLSARGGLHIYRYL